MASAAPLVEWTAMYRQGNPPPEMHLGNPRWNESHAKHLFEPPADKSKDDRRLVLSALTDATPQNVVQELENEADRATIIRSHALWDDEREPSTITWLHMMRTLDDAAQINARRLQRNPKEVLALRARQDMTTGEAHVSLCRTHASDAEANPSDHDALYLAIRCMPEGPEREARFQAEHQKHPGHGWLAWAAGVSLAEQQRWKEAAAALMTGWRAVGALRIDGAIELARVLRIHDPQSPDLDEVSVQTDALRYLLELETTNALEPAFLVAYRQLHAGDFDAAVTSASPAPPFQDTVVRWAAASLGATQAHVAASLALPLDRGLNSSTVWSTLALHALHGKDTQPLMDIARKLTPDAERLFGLLDCAWCAQEPERFADRLKGLSPELRGHALVMAIIALQDDAPAEWRREAEALLFLNERPRLIP